MELSRFIAAAALVVSSLTMGGGGMPGYLPKCPVDTAPPD